MLGAAPCWPHRARRWRRRRQPAADALPRGPRKRVERRRPMLEARQRWRRGVGARTTGRRLRANGSTTTRRSYAPRRPRDPVGAYAGSPHPLHRSGRRVEVFGGRRAGRRLSSGQLRVRRPANAWSVRAPCRPARRAMAAVIVLHQWGRTPGRAFEAYGTTTESWRNELATAGPPAITCGRVLGGRSTPSADARRNAGGGERSIPPPGMGQRSDMPTGRSGTAAAGCRLPVPMGGEGTAALDERVFPRRGYDTLVTLESWRRCNAAPWIGAAVVGIASGFQARDGPGFGAVDTHASSRAATGVF